MKKSSLKALSIFSLGLVFGLGFGVSARALTHTDGAETPVYTIDLEAQINQAAPVKGSVKIKEGETGTLTFRNTMFEIVPTRTSTGAVKIQTTISVQENGRSQVLSKPQVIVRMNEGAEIDQKSGSGQEEFKVKLTPHETRSL
jgi:hypothetical protein